MAGKVLTVWVSSYLTRDRSGKDNLPNSGTMAEGFSKALAPTGTILPSWSNDEAWDQIFEPGGRARDNATSVESADIVYFVGHGNLRGLTVDNMNHTDGQVHHSVVRWGTAGTLKWMVLDSCFCLWNDPTSYAIDRWRNAFQGLHFILGFASTSLNRPHRGKYFGDYLVQGYRVAEAWQKACEDSEEDDIEWAFLRVDGRVGQNGPPSQTWNDQWVGGGRFVSGTPTHNISIAHCHLNCKPGVRNRRRV